ncbi:hypothetical protein SynWH8103_00685 [Synechococcus sp. WH 8103]|nr:hypothetical protein SynWH8103_00685 [Synechococcus sp. WH 8103]
MGRLFKSGHRLLTNKGQLSALASNNYISYLPVNSTIFDNLRPDDLHGQKNIFT